ncbi:MAG: 30S ribosomal protein S16 [Myxococcales bacterium]|nr:30S ribosomal protein S16 [Myxococcales bacterium]
MAVHIRLSRAGTSKVPFYRIVAADHRAPRGGRFLERLGTWDPRRDALVLDLERAEDWMSKGAQPSATVASLIKRGKSGAGSAMPAARSAKSAAASAKSAAASAKPAVRG